MPFAILSWRRGNGGYWAILALVVCSMPVRADGVAAGLAEHYLQNRAVTRFDADIPLPLAMSYQGRFVAALKPELGAVVGYKAGLTSPAAQARFGATQPIRGVLLERMLLNHGVSLRWPFAARPVAEGDLLVRVRSSAINEAETPAQALAALDAVMPFIEVPDLLFAADVKVSVAALAAANVGARFGVKGEAIVVEPTAEWRDRLRRFTVVLVDQKGEVLARGGGRELLGDPLAVVLWLRDSLRADGIPLKPGELLSLGSATRLLPVSPNTALTARYEGLDPRGPVEVSVRFE